MDSTERITYAQIEAQRQKEAKERYEQAQAWAREVTEELANQQSAFLKDFTEAEARILGLSK